jgi:S1-C subfamily serine protease
VSRAGAAGLAAALAVAAAGCGGGGHGSASQPQGAQTTRVEVVQQASPNGVKFDPEAIYKNYAPGVVTVISVLSGGGGLFGGSGNQAALGSGFVLDGQGDIATNAHVVTTGQGARIKKAAQVYVEFADGNRVPAHIVGDDPNSDIALLRVPAAGLKLRPLPLGSSAGLVVGEPVAAIGSPFGEQQSLSVGVISALDRSITSLTSFDINNAIQTDAAINHGNSGGPLIDARGRVIGINSQIKSTGGGGEGVGFAVPVDTVRRSIGQLRETGQVRYSFLGVSSVALYPQLARKLGLGVTLGALVAKVDAGSPADKAGVKAGTHTITFEGDSGVPVGGDVIVSVDGKAVRSPTDVANLVSMRNPGQKISVGLVHGHARRTVTVTLVERPASAAP